MRTTEFKHAIHPYIPSQCLYYLPDPCIAIIIMLQGAFIDANMSYKSLQLDMVVS